MTRPTVPDLDALGVTYRQLDHWTRKGYLHPVQARPVSGYRRTWPPGELEVAERMARLVGVGLLPSLAHRVARGQCDVGRGVRITVDPPPTPPPA